MPCVGAGDERGELSKSVSPRPGALRRAVPPCADGCSGGSGAGAFHSRSPWRRSRSPRGSFSELSQRMCSRVPAGILPMPPPSRSLSASRLCTASSGPTSKRRLNSRNRPSIVEKFAPSITRGAAVAVARFGCCSCRGAPACALAAGFLRFELIDIVPEVGSIEALRNAVGDRVSGKAADRAGDHAAEHVGSVVHAEINARNAHGEREQQRRPADLLLPRRNTASEAAIAAVIWPEGKLLSLSVCLPSISQYCWKNAAVVRIRAGPGDERFKADVCYQSADGKREQHR